MTFGAAVRAAREAREWSQGDLGRKVGVSAAQISRIESGVQEGAPSTLGAIALELDLDMNLLKPGLPALEDPRSQV